MPVPLLDLKAQYRRIRGEVDEAIREVMESQHFVMGPKVEELESRVADYSACKYGIAVSSGTDALLVCLMAEGIGPGDEVIVPDYSFFATAGVVSRLGATPVFVDIEPRSFNLDPSAIAEAITPRTRALIPVHLFGQPADMAPILAIAEEHKLAVIEDAAQAIGARYHGRPAGSMGHYGCLSFFPSKNLGGIGDGGMVVTNDGDRAERVRTLRVHGARRKYHHTLVGGNFRLDTIQAAVLIVKLRHLNDWTDARQRNAELYRSKISATGALRQIGLPEVMEGRTHIYNQFVIRCEQRDQVRATLAERGIATEVYYPVPFHAQECFANVPSAKDLFPESDRAARTSLALPIYPELDAMQLGEVVTALVEAV